MSRYIDIIDTSFATSFKATYGTAVIDNDIFKYASYATKVGISSFEVAGFNSFEDIAFSKKHLAFNYLYDFRQMVGVEANLNTTINASTLTSMEPLSKEFFRMHAKLMSKYNVNTIRVFDNLNNIENINTICNIYKQESLGCEIIILLKERYSIEYYEKLFDELIEKVVEFDTVVFVDNFGACRPNFVAEIISLAKMLLGEYVFVGFKSNDSLSLGLASYLAALSAGVDMLDVALYPLSGGFGAPDLLSLLHATKELDYNLGDLSIENITMYQKELSASCASLEPIKCHSQNSNNFSTPFPAIEIDSYNKEIDRAMIKDRVTDEIMYIFKLLKIKNISQPFSKHIFEQALLNIKNGRWKIIDSSFATLLASSSLSIDSTIASKLNTMVRQKRVSQTIDEYLFTNALEKNLENRFLFSIYNLNKTKKVLNEAVVKKKKILSEPSQYCVEVGNKKFLVKISDVKEEIEVVDYNSDANTTVITSSFTGRVMSINISVGSNIIEGELLMTVWSDGKEQEVVSEIEGIVYNIYVKEGQEIGNNTKLISVEL
jgi:pyruvate carboxylase subunit B